VPGTLSCVIEGRREGGAIGLACGNKGVTIHGQPGIASGAGQRQEED
jgi:hypothetical protein